MSEVENRVRVLPARYVTVDLAATITGLSAAAIRKRIERGHIYLDPSEWWSTRSVALIGDPITKWLPHEIGHVLGLQHCPGEDQTMSETGPYSLPSNKSFAQLQHLYAPKTPVFTWVQCVMDVSGEAE